MASAAVLHRADLPGVIPPAGTCHRRGDAHRHLPHLGHCTRGLFLAAGASRSGGQAGLGAGPGLRRRRPGWGLSGRALATAGTATTAQGMACPVAGRAGAPLCMPGVAPGRGTIGRKKATREWPTVLVRTDQRGSSSNTLVQTLRTWAPPGLLPVSIFFTTASFHMSNLYRLPSLSLET